MDDMTQPTTAAEPATPADDQATPPKKKHGSFARELPFLLLIAFVLALVIKAFFVQAFYIPSGSMERTLLIKDRVLVNKVVYRFRDIHRGEIVVFNGLDSFDQEIVVTPAKGFGKIQRKIASVIGLGAPGEKDYIKRVIGVPGDVVACCTNGHVTVNGQELEEPYVYDDDKVTFGPVTVEKDKLFVMGDHRGNSSDSRRHGTVPQSKVIGRAFVVIWPVGHFKGLRVPHQFEGTTEATLPGTPWAVTATPPALGLALALPITAGRRVIRNRRYRRRHDSAA